MKALVFDRQPGAPIAHPALFSLIPDSALTPSGMPVFLPPLDSSWELAVGVAYRIGRLGKNIAPRFADRYIDGMTLGAWTVPVDLLRSLQAAGRPLGLLSTFDGALTLGSWATPALDSPVHTAIGGLQGHWSVRDIDIAGVLSVVSRYVTLKTGDVIIPMLSPVRIPVRPGDVIEGSLDGQDVIRVKIK